MQEVISDQSPQTTHDFAGLLAKLTATNPTALPDWSNEELVRDVATLSYEGALRTHARYKPADDTRMEEHLRTSRPTQPAAPTSERERKCASVTLRMSKAECEQLRARAAEAGLSVSAYLRLCAFEAETLRAQVKEALAELRRAPRPNSKLAAETATQPAMVEKSESSRVSRPGWLRRIMPDLRPARNLAGA